MATLRPHQTRVMDRLLKRFHQRGCGGVLLHASTGFGKTVVAVEFVRRAGLETALVLVPRKEIYKQWTLAVAKFGNVNIKVEMERSYCNRVTESEYFDIVIIDECHSNRELVFGRLVNAKNSRCIRYRFLLGLSATPDSIKEGTAVVSPKVYYDVYFDYIIKGFVFKQFQVQFIRLPFECPTMKKYDGSLDYTGMNKWLNENEERAEHLKRLVSSLVKPKTLILTKYINTVRQMESHLSECFRVTVMYGSKTTYDKSADVLIGTTSKIGEGFDIVDPFAAMIILDNVLDARQLIGRCRVDGFVLYDIYDNHSVYESHRRYREQSYDDARGLTRLLKSDLPQTTGEFAHAAASNCEKHLSSVSSTTDGGSSEQSQSTT